MPYEVDLCKLTKDFQPGYLSEAIVDIETGDAAFVVGENRDFAIKLVEFMNRYERIKDK